MGERVEPGAGPSGSDSRRLGSSLAPLSPTAPPYGTARYRSLMRRRVYGAPSDTHSRSAPRCACGSRYGERLTGAPAGTSRVGLE